jgi:hypothetical protein
VFTRALQWSLSWTRSIQSTPPHPFSLRSSDSTKIKFMCVRRGFNRPLRVFHLGHKLTTRLCWYISGGFIDVDKRSIGSSRVRHLPSCVGDLSCAIPFLLFGYSLSLPLLIFPGPCRPSRVWALVQSCNLTTPRRPEDLIACYSTWIRRVHSNTSRNKGMDNLLETYFRVRQTLSRKLYKEICEMVILASILCWK